MLEIQYNIAKNFIDLAEVEKGGALMKAKCNTVQQKQIWCINQNIHET